LQIPPNDEPGVNTGDRDRDINLILFMFFGLAVGAVITFILNRNSYLGLPYTVGVFITGALISVIADHTQFLGDLELSVQSWEKIDPELLLYLFLPALLFGEAMSLRWHFVKAVFPQALLMAGPGVLMGAYLMGSFIYYCVPSINWQWDLCMVFGAIVAATDPVAVVALLKDAGASPKLTILIIGESLMNDGTAMVLFTLYLNIMKGDNYSFSEVVLFFVEETLGAPLLGIAFGLLAVYCLSKANRPLSNIDTIVQTGITICCAYLVFFTAQASAEVSGVLACCGAGLMLAWLAPPLILEPHTLHNIWSFVEWVGNTLIFLLAGLIIGGTQEEGSIEAADFGITIVLYAAMMVIRCIVVAFLYPALSKVGLRCSAKDAVFVSWAGLRGALAMALALIVRSEWHEMGISQNRANKFFFYVGGMATLTLVVNATTAQMLLVKLGLLKEDDSLMSKSLLNQAKFQIRERLQEDCKQLSAHKYDASFDGKLNESDFTKYNTLLSTHENSMAESLRSLSSHAKANRFFGIDDTNNPMTNGMADTKGESPLNPEVVTYCRQMLLESCRVKYWDFIEDGFLPRTDTVTQSLLYSIDSGLRRADFQARRDWDSLMKNMKIPSFVKRVLDFIRDYVPEDWDRVHRFGDRIETDNVYFKVYALTSFIEANNFAQVKIVEMWGASSGGLSTPAEMEKILQESRDSVREAKIQLVMLDQSMVTSIIRQQANRVLLSKQVKYVKEMKEEGSLMGKHADKLFEMIEEDLDRLNQHKFEVFKENVQRVFTNRMSLLQSKRSSVFDPSVSRDEAATVSSAVIREVDEESERDNSAGGPSGLSYLSHMETDEAAHDRLGSSFSVSRGTGDDSDI